MTNTYYLTELTIVGRGDTEICISQVRLWQPWRWTKGKHEISKPIKRLFVYMLMLNYSGVLWEVLNGRHMPVQRRWNNKRRTGGAIGGRWQRRSSKISRVQGPLGGKTHPWINDATVYPLPIVPNGGPHCLPSWRVLPQVSQKLSLKMIITCSSLLHCKRY